MLKRKFFLTSFVAVLGSALISLMLSNSSNALNPENVVVQVAFVAPILITETNELEFGSIDVAMAGGDTVTINPDDTFSESAANVVGGTQASAKLDVTVTPGRLINILVDTVIDGADYTLSAWTCDYASGPDLACDGAGMSATSVAGPTSVVRVGAMMTGAGGATAGDDNGSFNVTVAYQ